MELAVGIYKLTAQADGFIPRESSVEIRSNAVTKLEVALVWIVNDEDFIYRELLLLPLETPVLNTTIQQTLRKPQSP
jgi:hypothetical protein